MAKLIRSLVVIGAIAILSPVHEGAALRTDAATQGRSILTTLMPEPEFRHMKSAAETAISVARQIKDLDPATRDMVLHMAASQLGSTAENQKRIVPMGAKIAVSNP